MRALLPLSLPRPQRFPSQHRQNRRPACGIISKPTSTTEREPMLVLSRRKYERILIGDDIEIVVVETSKGSVRLGIRAPKDIDVVRADPEPPERDGPT